MVECDAPVHGQFAPGEDAATIGLSDHMFVVLVVSKSHEVGAQLLHPTEQCRCMFDGVGAATARWRLGVDGDPMQERTRAVDHDVGAIGLNCTKPDVVGDLVTFATPVHFVQDRRSGVPPLGGDIQLEGVTDRRVDVEAWNAEPNVGVSAAQRDTTDHSSIWSHRQPGVLHEHIGYEHQVDGSGQPTKVPPI